MGKIIGEGEPGIEHYVLLASNLKPQCSSSILMFHLWKTMNILLSL